MKTINVLRVAIILLGILLSACASAAPANGGGGKSLSDVVFTGTIESIDGNQWVINGQTVSVDSSALRDGPFIVGDRVKIEAQVAADGSVTVQRVELPLAATEAAASGTSAPDDSLSTPQAGSTPQAPIFDDGGKEAFGKVDAITSTSITINGQTFTFAPGAEIQSGIAVGASVKLHFMINPDGSLSVTEVGISTDDDHSSVTEDANDDHGGDRSTSDDGSDHDANDDRGGDSDGSDDNSGGNSGQGG